MLRITASFVATIALALGLFSSGPASATAQGPLQVRDPARDAYHGDAWKGAGKYLKRGADVRRMVVANLGDRTTFRVWVSTLHYEVGGYTQSIVVSGTQGRYSFNVSASNRKKAGIIRVYKKVGTRYVNYPPGKCRNKKGRSAVKLGRDFTANSVIISVPNRCLPPGTTLKKIEASSRTYTNSEKRYLVGVDIARKVTFRFR